MADCRRVAMLPGRVASDRFPPHQELVPQPLEEAGLLHAVQRYQRRFDQPGTYPYFCEPHPFMTATVIVE